MNPGWVGLVSAIGALLGALVVALLNNRANRKSQERQFQHDANQRRLERERSLQREVFLGAIEAIGKWQMYLMRMIDLSLPNEQFPQMIEGSSEKIGKAYIIGSIETHKALNKLNLYFSVNGLRLFEMRQEMAFIMQKISRLEIELRNAKEEGGQLVSAIQIAEEKKDPNLKSLLSLVDEKYHEIQGLQTSLNDARIEGDSRGGAFFKEGSRVANEFAPVCVDALIAMRRELGLDVSGAFEQEFRKDTAELASKIYNNVCDFVKRAERKYGAGAAQP